MRILFCSHVQEMAQELGAAKVFLELARELECLGWEVNLFCKGELEPGEDFGQGVLRRLGDGGREYDVIDYPYDQWALDRTSFPSRTLMVARSVLLDFHLDLITIPTRPLTWKSRVRGYIFPSSGRHRRQSEVERRRRSFALMKRADLLNVSNSRDRHLLEEMGIPKERILVQPYAIGTSLKPELPDIPLRCHRRRDIVFLGTFDYRKGCLDLPVIFLRIREAVPESRFKLLGTKGMVSDKATVLRCFPSSFRSLIEVVPRFRELTLPNHLRSGSIGIFPSYLEGFGLALLEMMGAGIPVLAYDVPGPCDILDQEYLVPVGEAEALATKAIVLLKDPDLLSVTRKRVRERALEFDWGVTARETAAIYERNFEALGSR